MAIFAKYDGIDGEVKAAKHARWINVLSVDWGMHKPDPGAAGQSRRRGSVVVEDLTLTIEYDKAAPKLQEKCLKGAVIPKLEIEQTASYGRGRRTYLEHQLKNVTITSVQVHASGDDDAGPPTLVVANNFEEVKVTYTEYGKGGRSKGKVEYEWNVERGR